MKFISCAALAAGCLFLAGCQTPYVTPKLPSLQSRVDTVHDWDLLAERMIDRKPAPSPTHAPYTGKYFLNIVPTSTPVFVQLPDAASDFSVAFHDLLQNRLYEEGYRVALVPQGAQILSFKTETYHYNHREKDYYFAHALPWAAAGGLYTAVEGIVSVDTAIGAAALVAPFYDTFDTLDDRTHTELFVTMRVIRGGQLVYMRTEPLYIRRRDLKFYRKPQASETIAISSEMKNGWGR